MDMWDDRDKVRPIPIEEDTHDFGPGAETVVRTPRPHLPWMPLAIAMIALVIVGISLSAFGALRFDDPPAQEEDAFAPENRDDEGSTTTVTALPPRLDELLPGTTDRLTMIAVSDAGVWALLWDPSFREPKAVPLNPDQIAADGVDLALFDSAGRSVAFRRCPEDVVERRLAGDDDPGACDVYVGTPTDIGITPDISDAASFIWHASEVNRIAWVQTYPDGTSDPSVFSASVNPLSGELQDQRHEVQLTQPGELIQWDVHGFVVSDGTTTAYSPQGEALWSIDGFASSGTESAVAVGRDGTTWSLVDRLDGSEIVGSLPNESLLFVATSDQADLVGRLAAFGTSYSLTINGGGMQAPRILNLKAEHIPIGFSTEGRYFLFQSEEGNTISFVDWRTGAAKDVTAPPGYRIIGLDLG
jgi:hypothetical protein